MEFAGSEGTDLGAAPGIFVAIAGKAEVTGVGRGAAAVAAAYCDRGADVLQRIEGDFALALWDAHFRRLFLSRDPVGDRPLFFAGVDGIFAFASMPSGLFPLTGGEPDLDGLAAQRSGPLDGDRTPFRSIRRVLPGELVVLDADATVSRSLPWWPPADPDPDQVPDVEAVRALLDAAVRQSIPEQGPFACHLSSGRDSGAVAATAARLAPGRVIAFTGLPARGAALGRQKDRVGDEGMAAAALAASLGIQHVPVSTDDGLFDPLVPSIRSAQTMMHPLSNLGWKTAIDRAARDHGASTILVGSMGNLTLNAGGLTALQDHVRAGRLRRWAREVRQAAKRPDVTLKGAAAASLGPWIPQRLYRAALQRFGDYHFPDPDRFIRPAFRRSGSEPPTLFAGRRDWRAAFASGYLVADPGVRRLGVLARFGLVERDPLADRALADAMFRLPTEAFIKSDHFRPFADAVLADRLPPEVLAPRPRGLQSADWLARFDPLEAEAVIEEARTSVAVEQFLDLDALGAAIRSIKDLETKGFGRQIGAGWHLMEALQIAVFLYQIDKHADRFGIV